VLVAGFVMLAAVVVGLAYLAWRQQAASIRSQAELSVQAVGTLKADQIAAWVDERRGDAEVISGNRLLAAALTDMAAGRDVATSTAQTRSFLAETQRINDYTNVTLVAPDGSVILTVPATAPRSLLPRQLGLVAEAQHTGQVTSSDLYLTAGQARLDMIAPVLALRPGDAPVASVILAIDPTTFLFPFIQAWPLTGTSGETLLVERRGDRVVYLNELRFRKGTALRLSVPLTAPELPAAMAVRGRRGVVDGLDYRGVPVIAAIAPVPDTSWYVISKIDTGAVLGPIVRRGWLTAGFTFLIVGLAAAGTLLLWRARESQTTAELRESETQFRSLFESMTEGVALHELVVDDGGAPVDYRILKLNPAYEAQTGVNAAQARGKLSGEAYDTAEPPFFETYARTAQTGEPQCFQTYFAPLDKHFDITVVANGPDRFATIFEDITDRVRAREQIQRLNAELEQRVLERTAQLDAANKELEAFAYSVSHDLRAPLRHISGFSALLAERMGDGLDEKSLHYLDTISRSVAQMGVLIDDLLQFSRSGRSEMHIGPVDMDAVLREALEPLQQETSGRRIEWSIGALPRVVGDHALLRQVWANLLGNAVKYTRGRAPAHIEVGARDGDEDGAAEDVFWVRDNGVGFDMAYQHKLFGVFQRLHDSSEFEGTGIGLANVQRIVNRLGGRVWAEGEPGMGATFYFSLPRRKESPS
jgi:signal transduction histidine kinase